MKRNILLLVALCLTTIANAQYNVGDVFEKDDIKSIVFYVDDTGEHGLAITVTDTPNFTDVILQQNNRVKKMDKTAKKQYKQNKKIYDKNVKTYYADLVGLTTSNGADNMRIIKEYCAAHNIDMGIYFPSICWAESLGEGWFVPGEREAILYANYIAFGVGEPSYKGTNKKDITNKYKELDNQVRANSGYENLHLPQYIETSTIGHNSHMANSWDRFKTLELREEQASIAGISFRTNCYYDINAYIPMLGMGFWISYCNVAVYEF